MKLKHCAIFFASLLLSIDAYSADTMPDTDDDYSAYSIEAVMGDMPIRSVVVKRSSPYFTSYLGFQFDCASQKYSQTGFYSSSEAALAELSKIEPSNGVYTTLSDSVNSKACKLEPSLNVSNGTQPSRAL